MSAGFGVNRLTWCLLALLAVGAAWAAPGPEQATHHLTGLALGRGARIVFQIPPGTRCWAGLSHGLPTRDDRTALALTPEQLARLAEPTGRVSVRLLLPEGLCAVQAGTPAWGPESWRDLRPLDRQTGVIDTIWHSGGVQVTVEPLPDDLDEVPLAAEALGSRWALLTWRRPARQVASWILFRNGRRVVELPGSMLNYRDDSLSPRTRYVYRLAAHGYLSPPAGLVTGPETETARLTSGHYDALVYAASPSGIAAALALGRRGRSVALVEPTQALGGLITGGLTRTDYGSIHALGGPFREFMLAIDAQYAARYPAGSPNQELKRGGLYFEPSLARDVLTDWLRLEPTVSVFRGKPLVGAVVREGVLRAAVFEDPRLRVRSTLSADVFIDASYEGDLAGAAGCAYMLGRESRADFDEAHAGRLWWDVWQRKVVEVPGQGDRRVQAYNYRLCLTRNVADRLPPPRPDDYHRETYLGLLPDIRRGRLKALEDILSILPVPNGKSDANNHPQGNPSSDLVGGADRWPEAGPAERRVIAEAHRQHVLGLLWFLRFDEAVPESLRRDAQSWGLARDEFPESSGWPSALYVREGRRILGEYVFTEHDAMAAPGALRPTAKHDSIAVGAYPIDSHATGGRHPDHPDWLEGFFYLARGETKPYGIPYRVMLPKGVDGLLVASAVSSTHVGYGSLRMEPVFMSLGLAAGEAADQALANRTPPREIDVRRLQARLLAAGQVLTVFEDVNVETPGWAGFNVWGTLGVFPSYQAEPRKPLTVADWRAWLLAAGPAYAGGAPPAREGLLGLPELQASVDAVAEALGVPSVVAQSTARGAAMAALWAVTEQTLRP